MFCFVFFLFIFFFLVFFFFFFFVFFFLGGEGVVVDLPIIYYYNVLLCRGLVVSPFRLVCIFFSSCFVRLYNKCSIVFTKKRIIWKFGINIVTCYVGSMLINVAGQSYILTYIQESLLYKDTQCY